MLVCIYLELQTGKMLFLTQTCPQAHQTSKVRNITKQLDNLIIILELQINNFSKHLILELEINNKQWQSLRHE